MSKESDPAELQAVADMLKAIAHPVRLCIVRGLWQNGCCNVTHMQQCLGAPQSTVSQHLARLRQAGIIEGRRRGLEICYQLRSKKTEALMACLFSSAAERKEEPLS